MPEAIPPAYADLAAAAGPLRPALDAAAEPIDRAWRLKVDAKNELSVRESQSSLPRDLRAEEEEAARIRGEPAEMAEARIRTRTNQARARWSAEIVGGKAQSLDAAQFEASREIRKCEATIDLEAERWMDEGSPRRREDMTLEDHLQRMEDERREEAKKPADWLRRLETMVRAGDVEEFVRYAQIVAPLATSRASPHRATKTKPRKAKRASVPPSLTSRPRDVVGSPRARMCAR